MKIQLKKCKAAGPICVTGETTGYADSTLVGRANTSTEIV